MTIPWIVKQEGTARPTTIGGVRCLELSGKVPEKVTRMAAIIAERYDLHVRRITRKIVRDEDYGAKIFEMVNRTPGGGVGCR